MELRIGNLLEPVQDEVFDTICCNPPLLAIPEDVAFPFIADGGRDGLDITMQLLSHLRTFLSHQGQCYIVGTLLGDQEGPNVSRIEKTAREVGLNVHLTFPYRENLVNGSKMLDALIVTASRYNQMKRETLRTAFLKSFAKKEVEYMYSFLLHATVASDPLHARVEQSSHYFRNSSFWSV